MSFVLFSHFQTAEISTEHAVGLEANEQCGRRNTVLPNTLLPTPAAVAGVGFSTELLCLSVFLYSVSKKPLQLASPNLTYV